MEDCLQEYPEQRPSFEEIDERLKRFNAETATPSYCKEKSKPLVEVLPQPLANALLEGRKVEAQNKEMVTIFYLVRRSIVLFRACAFIAILTCPPAIVLPQEIDGLKALPPSVDASAVR